MDYSKSINVGDNSIDESFEGTPQEIIELMDGIGRIERNKRIGKNNTSSEILEKLGIPVMDINGNLRNMEDIIDDLSDVFCKDKEEIIYDQDDAIKYIGTILNKGSKFKNINALIKGILDLEEEYMKNIGLNEKHRNISRTAYVF